MPTDDNFYASPVDSEPSAEELASELFDPRLDDDHVHFAYTVPVNDVAWINTAAVIFRWPYLVSSIVLFGASLFLLTLTVFLADSEDNTVAEDTTAVLSSVIIVFVTVAPFIRRWIDRRDVLRSLDSDLTVNVYMNTTGIMFVMSAERTQIVRWTYVCGVTEYKGNYMINIDNGHVRVIPKEQFPDQALAYVHDHLEG